VVKQLAPIELNIDYIKQEKFDPIMDTKTKETHQQTIQLDWVVKAGKFLHQGKWLTQESEST